MKDTAERETRNVEYRGRPAFPTKTSDQIRRDMEAYYENGNVAAILVVIGNLLLTIDDRLKARG
jgi:hypothetical protein